jgi:hypothetical protein
MAQIAPIRGEELRPQTIGSTDLWLKGAYLGRGGQGDPLAITSCPVRLLAI